MIPPEVDELIGAIDMLHIMPPIAGGFLDQTAAFVDGLRFWRGEELRWARYREEKKNG